VEQLIDWPSFTIYQNEPNNACSSLNHFSSFCCRGWKW